MITRIAIHAILFLLPFIIFFIYVRVISQDTERQAPLIRLFGVGLILSVGGFVFWAINDGSDAGSTYLPAHMEDGKIIPGEMTPTKKAN
jgi:hypothetical protein